MSGNYSTKSGYALTKVHNGSQTDTFKWKRYVWNVECSPKLNHFLWKLKNNALAVGEELGKRGIQVDGKCKRCGESESIFHVMFSCKAAVKVWELVPATGIPARNSCHTMEDLLKACARMTNLPSSGLTTPLYPWIFWVLWTSRNQLLFEDKSFSETEMLVKAIKAAKEWQTSLPVKKQIFVSHKDIGSSNIPNHLPEDISFVYSDAAWNCFTFAGGLSWICTTAAGAYRFQGTTNRRYIASALAAEALALQAGLSEAVNSGIKDVICYSDSKSLVDMITGNKSVTALRGILHDIGVLSLSFTSISFKFISRVCNDPADRLAKNALFQFSNNLSEVDHSVSV